jgi:hypothetical protein
MACAADARRVDESPLMESFGLIHWIILLLIVWVVWASVRGSAQRAGSTPMICTKCEHQGPGLRQTRGHFALEVVLWLLFIVPGLIYSIWRLTTRRVVCARCSSPELVPIDTPAGRRLSRSPDEAR